MNIIKAVTSRLKKPAAKNVAPASRCYVIQQKFSGTDVLTGAVRVLGMLPHPTEWEWGTTAEFEVVLINGTHRPNHITIIIGPHMIRILTEIRCGNVGVTDDGIFIADWQSMVDRDLADMIQPYVLSKFPDSRSADILSAADFDGDPAILR